MSRRPQHSAYFVDLVSLILAREERSEHVELCHDSSKGKDVDGRVVSGRSHEDLRTSVPSSRHVVSERRSRPDLSCQPEVSDLHIVLVDQHVLRLHVPVKEPMFVHVLQTFEGLVDD